MRSCSNSAVARLASISRSCAGPPPRRGPLVGVGTQLSLTTRAGPREIVQAISWGALEPFVLGVALVVVVHAVVDDRARVEPGGAVLERQAHAVQFRLDL